MKKLVNGILIDLTAQEIADKEAEDFEFLQRKAILDIAVKKNELKEQLKEIDFKSIRALREGDVGKTRLAQLEVEAQELRQQLVLLG